MSTVDSQTTSGFKATLALDAVTSLQHGSQGVAKLLSDLADVAEHVPTETNAEDAKCEKRLTFVRLGMATALHSALRAKHAPSASHCLRVALVCAAWSDRLRLSQSHRDRLEVAALMHDIGKIGIPDKILRKPGKLSVEEQLTVGLCPRLGIQILSGCCDDLEMLEIIKHGSSWYSGRRDQELSGEAIPLGSRMLAIADAFDAMTTDHVYRPALSRETAMSQLRNFAGTQFDPELAHDYCLMMQQDAEKGARQVLFRWLQNPVSKFTDPRWAIKAEPSFDNILGNVESEQLRFHDQLLHNMNDGVIFIDRDSVVRNWNQAAERLTGMVASAAIQNTWAPALLGLADDEGPLDESHCPIRQALHTSSPFAGRYQIYRPDGTSTPVLLNAIPVKSDSPGLCGVVLIVHDSSQQRHLEERVESLHRQANHDPLTKVANRAAFDRRLNELTTRRAESGASFSLIICDIDHFKRVNDLHGHQAGDEALVTFAKVLTAHSREDDLVGRYGGEEFVLLSPDCDLSTATRRAETVRIAVEQTLLPSIGNQSVTASFGVTEVQAGDSPDSVVARADRALLRAKDDGRNRVIQLGSGAMVEADTPKKRRRSIWGWFDRNNRSEEMTTELITPVPASFAIDKLRGFISDHKAEIVKVSEGNLHLRVNVHFGSGGRRNADSQIPFNVRLRLVEASQPANPNTRRLACIVTKVKIELSPVRTRDRRRQEVNTCAQQVVLALKSYLMGRFETD